MIRARAYLIFIFAVAIFFVLVAKLYDVQIKHHDKYIITAIKQQQSSKKIKAERGKIFDSANELLAYTKNEVSFYLDNRMSKAKVSDSTIARKFSQVFGETFQHYMDIINSGKKQVCLVSKAPKRYIKNLENFRVDRLYYIEDNTRIYPYGSLASHVLGYVNRNMNGVNGIESQFDEQLQGKDGLLIYDKDANGKMVGVDKENSVPAQNGNNVVLTINKEYQKILDEELLQGINEFGGESAVGIILNPNNGEILALSNIPNFDPANYNLFPDATRRNRAISDTYEPGSTIKSIFLSALLQEKLVDPNEVINTESGKYKLRGVWIRDTHSYDKLTVAEVLAHSSNVGIVKLSSRISDDKFYKYYRDFGFGNPTHIDLPGEVRGSLKKPSEFSRISKAFMSHGYEISATPIQLTMAYAALVNGGVLYKPQIVKSVINEEGDIILKNKPEKIRRVISEETSSKIIKLMENVVEEGTGKNARLANIRVGGKTGTSHRYINGTYSNSEYNASFVGFFPVQNPQLVVYIWVQSPKHGKYGGQVAGPIFRRVSGRIVKSDIKFAKYKQKIIRDYNRRDKIAINLKLNEENFAVHSNPAETKKVSLKTETVERFTMPNLKNLPLRKALAIISATGLKVDVKGAGKVVWQSIVPGKKIRHGQKLKIKCSIR